MPHRLRYVEDACLMGDPLDIYHSMLNDIENAQHSIYLETFRFENDPIGIKFRNLLSKKAKQGLEINILVDDWGTSVSEKFFKEIIYFGGHVKYFKKLRLALNFFSVNHERDHRKLLIIDDKISYISSINVTNYNLNWRESALRIKGDLSISLKEVFLQNFHLKNSYKFDKRKYTQPIHCGQLTIIPDVPSVRITPIRKKLLEMIRNASSFIHIETPYFLPTYLLREALMRAAKNGVKVEIVTSLRSDVTVVNIYRQRYFGKLYEAGVKIYFYQPSNLHAKLMVCDNNFYIGSSNFDYRSFRYQFEVGLFGKNALIMNELNKYIDGTMSDCIAFDIYEWYNRGITQKLLEWAIIPIRHFL